MFKTMLQNDVYKPDTFLYFAYGGNLLTARIHMHNPTAEFVSIARLDNYRVDFIKYSSFWGGPTSTLVATANSHVWGVIWRLHKDDMVSLDDQSEVDFKKYYVKNLIVSTPYIGNILCRTYIQKVGPLPRGDEDPIPIERWPSLTLKQVMIRGAIEHGLPEYYIKGIKKLKHNGEEGYLKTAFMLMRYGKERPCECRITGRIPRKPLKLDLRKRDRNPRKK